MTWEVTLRGGAFDGETFDTDDDLGPVLIVWLDEARGGCFGTFDPDRPTIVLATAEAYHRGEVDLDERTAEYEVGEGPGCLLRERQAIGFTGGAL